MNIFNLRNVAKLEILQIMGLYHFLSLLYFLFLKDSIFILKSIFLSLIACPFKVLLRGFFSPGYFEIFSFPLIFNNLMIMGSVCSSFFVRITELTESVIWGFSLLKILGHCLFNCLWSFVFSPSNIPSKCTMCLDFWLCPSCLLYF